MNRAARPAKNLTPGEHAAGRHSPLPQCVPPLPLTHPAVLFAALVTAAILVLSVTFDLRGRDFWQHLAVGRFIWEQHRLPLFELWIWPTYGESHVDYAWGFEALLWPFWKLGGVTGLFVWRWLGILTVFGLAWAAVRRMGAKGLLPLVVISLCAMTYRVRTQVRPEEVAAMLLVAEILLLEARRHGSRVHPGWLVLIAWVWANTHISYYQFFAVLGVHVLASHLRPRSAGDPPLRDLWFAGLAAAAISFVNPWGWRTLWQPFEFWFTWRHEALYQRISELMPVVWSTHVRDGLPLLVILWPILTLWHPRRARLDLVEVMMCAMFTATVFVGSRFVGNYALVAAVYLARDLDAWAGGLRRPAWTIPAWPRAGLVAGACVLVALPDLSRPDKPLRVHLAEYRVPVGACDFIQRQDLHGRLFNQMDQGGYICFRFWPRRDQLPFMGIHPDHNTAEQRRLYMNILTSPASWSELDAKCSFDYLLLSRKPPRMGRLLDYLDRDSTWTRVFGDDFAYVFVRSHGPFARLAADSAYTVVPAGEDSLFRMGERMMSDSVLRARVETELRRETTGSRFHARALGMIAGIAITEGRLDDARHELEKALVIDPVSPGVRPNLGFIALQQGRPKDALRWFEDDARVTGARADLELRRGQVAEALGDLDRARACYLRQLRKNPADKQARVALDGVLQRLGR